MSNTRATRSFGPEVLARYDSAVADRRKKRTDMRNQCRKSNDAVYLKALHLAEGGYGTAEIVARTGISAALARALVTGE